ncbi:response regulator [Flavobacterium cheonhonense]|uniref:Response regulator n=1 Tax=Flavobacterium cheonhonense TaxID=706185 RepID=A0ABP7TPY7_9FLAO|nr:response regulator [Flavobacterium cheonhonense]
MKKRHIMLIDDNDIDNFITHHVLTKAAVADKITTMTSAIEALEYLDALKDDFENFPDFIFLDIAMPLMDGFGFLNEAIHFPKISQQQCLIAMLSSSVNKHDVERSMQYPFVKNYFNKPLKIDMLKDID